METVFTTLNWLEAQIVAGLLQSNGLAASILDAELSRVNPFYSGAVGGIKVAVPSDQVEAAEEILEEYRGKGGLDPSSGASSGFG